MVLPKVKHATTRSKPSLTFALLSLAIDRAKVSTDSITVAGISRSKVAEIEEEQYTWFDINALVNGKSRENMSTAAKHFGD